MKTKEIAKYIIACKIAGVDNYIFNAPFGADNKRNAVLTTEIEKARRFYDEQEAKNYILRLKPIKNRAYVVEEFAPAAQSKMTAS